MALLLKRWQKQKKISFARKIEGVQNVKMLVLKETKDFSEWLDREIERKIVETSRKPSRLDVGIVTR